MRPRSDQVFPVSPCPSDTGYFLLTETNGSDGSAHRAVHRSNQHRDPRLSGNVAAREVASCALLGLS